MYLYHSKLIWMYNCSLTFESNHAALNGGIMQVILVYLIIETDVERESIYPSSVHSLKIPLRKVVPSILNYLLNYNLKSEMNISIHDLHFVANYGGALYVTDETNFTCAHLTILVPNAFLRFFQLQTCLTKPLVLIALSLFITVLKYFVQFCMETSWTDAHSSLMKKSCSMQREC